MAKTTLLFKKLVNFNFQRHIPELFEKIEDMKLKNRVNIKTEGAFIGIVAAFKNERFLYIRAYKEYIRKGGLFDGNHKKLKKTETINGEYHAIIITSNGSVLHETSRFFHGDDIKDLLIDLFRSKGFHQISIKDVKNFDIKIMRTFYKTAKRIVGLTIKEIGELTPNPQMPPEDIEKMTKDIAEGSNFIDLKSGVNKDLKHSQLINKGLAKRSNIKKVRGYDEDGEIFDVANNGRVKVHLSDDEEKQATKLYRIVEKILGVFQG